MADLEDTPLVAIDMTVGRAAVAALDLDAAAVDNHGAGVVTDHERRGLVAKGVGVSLPPD
ncbi:MAG: hypothetical protein WAS21_13140 [Geminicoccaceae bacterium]